MGLARERWRRVQQLCEAVEAVPRAGQAAALARLEPDDSLRREALGLLRAMEDEARTQNRLGARDRVRR